MNSKQRPLPVICLAAYPLRRTDAGQCSFADLLFLMKSLKKLGGFRVLSLVRGLELLYERIASWTSARVTTGVVRGFLGPCQRLLKRISMTGVLLDSAI